VVTRVRRPQDDALARLRISRDGDWFDGDVEVTHPGVLRVLRRGLRRDVDGYFIESGVRIPVDVEDAPFVITRIQQRGETLYGVLSDETEEAIDPASLRIGASHVPYCAVKGGAFEARLSRAATFQLLGLADYDEVTEQARLKLGASDYTLRSGG